MDESSPRAVPALRPLLSAWLPVVVWAALIFFLSAQPDLRFVPDEGLDFVVRKLGHMGVFGILAVLLWRALAGTTAWRRPWAAAFALTVLYAASDELHQGLVAGRHVSAFDVGIDAVGALIANFLTRIFHQTREQDVLRSGSAQVSRLAPPSSPRAPGRRRRRR